MAANGNAEFQRLVSLYESNSANFQKAFGITVAFGLFIGLTVLLPYALNIYEYEQNRLQIINETETIRQNNSTYNQANSSAEKLSKSIRNLRDNIDSTKLMMNTQIMGVNSSLSDANKVLTNINDPATYERLNNILNKREYQKNETVEFARIVLGSFDNSIKMYEERYSNKAQELNSIKKRIDISWSNIREANKTIDDLNSERKNLTQRWEEIQSPYGNLPIDFTSLLAIFPIALTSGYVLCSIWLKESIRLRSFIHAVHNSEKVLDLAPLWVEPRQKKVGILFLQFLLFFIPVLIALLSVLMIVFAWEHAPSPPFPSGSEVNKAIYYAVYGVCFGLFGFSFASVLHQVWKYDDSQNRWTLDKDWG
jgi:hypothetical protein